MKIVMKRLAVLPFLVAVAACPGDKRTAQISAESARADSIKRADSARIADTATDLSKVVANVPKIDPDTFKVRTPPATATVRGRDVGIVKSSFPDAPAPLVDAVQREQGATRFCYTEFGQKADPSLRGSVAMVVTVSNSGVSDARVGDSRWTGSAGRAVNRCLDQKAKQAWNVSPGAVRPGRYVVQLSFSGAQ